MARILIATTPFVGHVNPLLPIARALVARGHEVRWYTGETFRARVEATGAGFVPLRHAPATDEHDLDAQIPARARLSGVSQLKFDLKHVFGDAVPGQLRDLQELHAEFVPDALLADPTFFSAPLYSERHGVPYAEVGIMPLPIMSRNTAPFGLGILPSDSPLGRLRNRALNWAVEHVIFADVQRHLDGNRIAAGLPPMRRFFMAEPSPYLFMQLTVPAFEYRRGDLPPQVHFVGPVPAAAPAEWEAPSWWTELGDGRPVVHVTQGTVATDAGQLLAPTIQALADEPVLVVATTGGRPLESVPLTARPANLRLERIIPHAHLLPHVDVMVTNGGYGGVQVALANGVPLVVAGATEDKPEVANRVAWAGAGVNLHTATPTPTQVREAVRAVLADGRYRERARSLRAEYARYDAPQRAVALLERLAATGRPVLRDEAAGEGLPAMAPTAAL